ncbi:MAG: hypothetical protein AAGL96_16875 [Pseudomonadota bacterium]
MIHKLPRPVAVQFQANWLNSDTWHIELRCSDRLPVTDTGYRSIFVPGPRFEGAADVAAYVRSILDEAGKLDEWQRYLEDSRQLKLF